VVSRRKQARSTPRITASVLDQRLEEVLEVVVWSRRDIEGHAAVLLNLDSQFIPQRTIRSQGESEHDVTELSHCSSAIPVIFAAGLAEPDRQCGAGAQFLAFVAERPDWMYGWTRCADL
jgi:hypothetical protein